MDSFETHGWTAQQWLDLDPTPVQRFARVLLTPWLHSWYRQRFIGVENVPTTGGVLATPNHTAWSDPLCQALPHRRRLRFMGKAELIRAPLGFGWLLRHGGVFPVRRNQSDRAAMGLAELVLRDGQYLVVYPEGTRCRTYGGGMRAPRTGAARLALATGCTILPIATYGLQPGTGREHLPRWLGRMPFVRRVTTVYGKPFSVPATVDPSRERIEEVRDEIWRHVTAAYEVARAATLQRGRPSGVQVVGDLREPVEVADEARHAGHLQ